MKKYFLFAILICALVLAGCAKKRGTDVHFVPAKNENIATSTSADSDTATSMQTDEPVSDIATSTAVDTENWKTYRNEEYGFEVKYPSDLIFKDNAFWTQDNYKYRFEVHGTEQIATPEFSFKIFNLINKTVDDVIEEEYLDKEYYRDNKNNIKNIEKIGNNDFIRIKHLDSSGFSFYVIQGDFEVRFATIYNDTSQIKKILSTFKFIE